MLGKVSRRKYPLPPKKKILDEFDSGGSDDMKSEEEDINLDKKVYNLIWNNFIVFFCFFNSFANNKLHALTNRVGKLGRRDTASLLLPLGKKAHYPPY